MKLDRLAPDLERLQADLHELSGLVEPDLDGWSRPVFSESYRAAREWVARKMADAGLQVHVDPVGNIVGTREGRGVRAALATGSHTDTVRGGGRFDGIVGVLAGIEVARRLRETGTVLEHDLRVVDFLGEEPNDHGVSCIGSRAVVGAISADYLAMPDGKGVALGERLDSRDDIAAARWASDEVAGFVELHVEQGPVLERDGLQLGVVTAIAGIERAVATFHGRPDHAGTMPMGERHDALLTAAEAVLAVEQIGCSAPDAVATVGRVESLPGALNIVPSWARVWSELRSASTPWLDRVRGDLTARIADVARARGVDVELDWLNDQPPVPTTRSVQDLIASSASSIGYSWRAMPSGAGHDAAHIASLAPTGMIFIPSQGGRSHCPEEWTDVEAIGVGTHTLAATLLAMDTAPFARQEEQ
ncbi:M20 family metallo-hydrolase [Streptomyces sp. NPDC101225]|uniref:M20 family metallo-hydrolase n=1 Tax=Streptomyces sp. NPDC101225 TaxID=3366135 RepID=UPI00381758BC